MSLLRPGVIKKHKLVTFSYCSLVLCSNLVIMGSFRRAVKTFLNGQGHMFVVTESHRPNITLTYICFSFSIFLRLLKTLPCYEDTTCQSRVVYYLMTNATSSARGRTPLSTNVSAALSTLKVLNF